MSDRLPLPDSLEQAIEASKYSPSDYELAQKRAKGWEQLTQKVQRKHMVWRLSPIVGVLASAAVAALIFVPSLNPWKADTVQISDPSDGPTQEIVSLSKPDDEPKKDQQEQGSSYLEIRELKTKLYREQDLELLFDSIENNYDVVRDAEGATYLIKGDQKVKVLNDTERAEVVDEYDHYLLMKADEMQADGTKYWLIDINDAKSYPVMLGELESMPSIYNANGKLEILYLGYDSEAKGQQLYGVDVKTGERRVAYASDGQVYNTVRGDDGVVVLGSDKKIVISDGAGWKTLAESAEGGLRAGLFMKGQLLYTTGAGLTEFPGLSGGDYRGTARLHRYDVKTGRNELLLPGIGGDQNLIAPVLQGDGMCYLIGSFVADDATRSTPMYLAGTLQLYEVQPQGEPRMIYEKEVYYSDSHLDQINFNDANAKRNVQIGLIANPKKWQLRYTPSKSLIEEVIPYPGIKQP